ncbi:hypothetical protein AB0P07_30995 [Streptomyces sp. NPDC085944]
MRARAATASRAWATARPTDGPQDRRRARRTGVLLILLSLASAVA